jgi:hypothetical protein
MPNDDLLKVETCNGTPLRNKRMVTHQYRFVFVYIRRYYCCVDGPICDTMT